MNLQSNCEDWAATGMARRQKTNPTTPSVACWRKQKNNSGSQNRTTSLEIQPDSHSQRMASDPARKTPKPIQIRIAPATKLAKPTQSKDQTQIRPMAPIPPTPTLATLVRALIRTWVHAADHLEVPNRSSE